MANTIRVASCRTPRSLSLFLLSAHTVYVFFHLLYGIRKALNTFNPRYIDVCFCCCCILTGELVIRKTKLPPESFWPTGQWKANRVFQNNKKATTPPTRNSTISHQLRIRMIQMLYIYILYRQMKNSKFRAQRLTSLSWEDAGPFWQYFLDDARQTEHHTDHRDTPVKFFVINVRLRHSNDGSRPK